MFVTVAIVQALLAASAFALPTIGERLEKRAALHKAHPRHQSLPFQRHDDQLVNQTNVEYSSNWAGSVINSGAVGVAAV